MKISEMISNLTEILNESGDLECYAAIDDEGNGFNRIYYEPTLMANVDGEIVSLSQLEEYQEDDEEVEYTTVLCIN